MIKKTTLSLVKMVRPWEPIANKWWITNFGTDALAYLSPTKKETFTFRNDLKKSCITADTTI